MAGALRITTKAVHPSRHGVSQSRSAPRHTAREVATVSGNFRNVSDSDRMQRRLINMRGGHYAGGTSSAAQALRWLHVDAGVPAVDFPDVSHA